VNGYLKHIYGVEKSTNVTDLHIIILAAQLDDRLLALIIDGEVAITSDPFEGIFRKVDYDISKVIYMKDRCSDLIIIDNRLKTCIVPFGNLSYTLFKKKAPSMISWGVI